MIGCVTPKPSFCLSFNYRLCLSYYAPSLPDRFLRFYAYSNPRKRYPNLPPGNLGGFPLIGQAIHLMRSDSCASVGHFIEQCIVKSNKLKNKKMQKQKRKQLPSEQPISKQRKFTSSERVFQCSYLRSVEAIMRKWSMLSITGGIHRKMRSMAVKFTSSVKLRTLFIVDIHRQAVEILGGWQENSTFSGQEEAKKFAFYVMVKNMMNMELGTPEAEQLRKEYITFMKGMPSTPINISGTT